MKNSAEKILTVLGLGLLLIWGAFAQNPAISTFPYTADFGTTTAPGAHNDYWKFKAIQDGGGTESVVVASDRWGFSAVSGENLAACFTDNDDAATIEPAAFSPIFHLEKDDNTSYTVRADYKNINLTSGKHLVVRLHSVIDGEPYYGGKWGVYYNTPDPIKDANGKVRSVLIHNEGKMPKAGDSTYTYHISSDLIPESGDYCISFIIIDNLYANTKNTKNGEKFYLTGLQIDEIVGTDLAAGQIISPYTDPQAGTQAFSAFVMNRGGGTVRNFEACYSVDGGTAVKESFSQEIASDKISRITFKTLPDLQPGDHRLSFWVDEAADLDRSNDTVSCWVRVGSSGIATLPARYEFTEAVPYAWAMISDSFYAEPNWRFVQEGTHCYPVVSTVRQNGYNNNDYLVSPQFSFKKDKLYRVEFTFRSELAGYKSLALYACLNAGRDNLPAKELIWKQDRFEDRSDRSMVVYYLAKDDANRALAFHAYGPSSEGSLQIKRITVSQADTNTMDYFFDFDGTSSDDPQYLVGQNLDFIDYDGNLSKEAGTPGGWALYGENSGFNSIYSARSIGIPGKQGATKADDWMVFKPFYLESGKDYYLNFRTKMSSSNSGALEYYVQREGPRYDLAYEGQTGIKGRKSVSGSTYDTVRCVFAVEESGYHILSIRNVTEVNDIVTDPQALENYTVFVDNVSLGARERFSVHALYADVPYEARFGLTVSLGMTVRNFSSNTVEAKDIRYCYQIDDEEVCRETPASNLLSQVSSTYTFNRRASFNSESTQTVRFWAEKTGSDEVPDTVTVTVSKVLARELPFVEKFAEKSMDDWQSYPSARRVWQMQFGTETAHSGEWAAKCNVGSSEISDFLVTPLLKVEKDKTYRVSFFYKRDANNIGTNDSLRLFYAYNRYDNTGFLNQLAVFPQPASTEYDFLYAYIRFPETGAAFLSLKAELGGNTAPLYIDDFILVDSLQTNSTDYRVSDLHVSGNMSECDTMAIGRLSFKVTAGGFSMPENVTTHIRYDNGPAQDISFQKEMMDGEEYTVSLPMPMFSGGEHTVEVWLGLKEELDRRDDTVRTSFSVHSPQTVPFRDANISVVGSPRMSACFEPDSTGTYLLRYRYDATNAAGATVKLNLLAYGNNSIAGSRLVDEQEALGVNTLEKEIEISALGVYAFGIECVNLPVGGTFRVDSLWLEAKIKEKPVDTTGTDTTGIGTFALNEFRIQPNPAADFVEILIPEQATSLYIFDMQGRVCRHLVLQRQERIRLSLQDLRPGVYMVRGAGNSKAATRKLIKR
ncbi:MAG: T9SS type A sorting domain-containing protein [Bacteroides sp.]|nr:T9SS type A sorting domain-containing protein [Ruminococcus flavefaciens]MCM1554854.1 T9SS type A sorting domain-containing protein [Bacteroides sp.]